MPEVAPAVAQAVGLEFTTASRAAFLVQATAILTPLLETATGGRLSRTTWASCALALAGSIVISTSAGEPAAEAHTGGLAMLGQRSCLPEGPCLPSLARMTAAAAWLSVALGLWALAWA